LQLKKLYVVGFAMRALYKHRTAYALFDLKPQFRYLNLFIFLAHLLPSSLSSFHILLFINQTLQIVKVVLGLFTEKQ
jgi:hypothetical protein